MTPSAGRRQGPGRLRGGLEGGEEEAQEALAPLLWRRGPGGAMAVLCSMRAAGVLLAASLLLVLLLVLYAAESATQTGSPAMRSLGLARAEPCRAGEGTLQLSAKEAPAIPAMLYGTAWKRERTADLVVDALRAGFRGLDTANQPLHYREDLVGLGVDRFLREVPQVKRSDLFVQTKFSPHQEPNSYNGTPKLAPYDGYASVEVQVQQSVRRSLLHLQMPYVDCLVLHRPLPTVRETVQVWTAMEKFVKSGQVKQLGISNVYDLGFLQEFVEKVQVKPTVVQNRFYKDTCFDTDMRSWLKKRGMVYQSFWTLTANGPALDSPPVQSLVTSRRLTKEQVWFLFVRGEGVLPLTGTKDRTHMRQDLQVLQEPPLSEVEQGAIWQWLREHTGCVPSLP